MEKKKENRPKVYNKLLINLGYSVHALNYLPSESVLV